MAAVAASAQAGAVAALMPIQRENIMPFDPESFELDRDLEALLRAVDALVDAVKALED
jgi:hypothetical protein